MDLLIKTRDFYINFIYTLPESLTSFVLRMSLLLALTTAFLALAWLYFPWRNTFSQICVAFGSIIASLYIPVERFRESGKGALTFMVTIAFLCLIFLPNWFPFWMTPKYGNQQRIKKITRFVIWGLFVLQLIMG